MSKKLISALLVVVLSASACEYEGLVLTDTGIETTASVVVQEAPFDSRDGAQAAAIVEMSSTVVQTSLAYCSGGQGWQARISAEDREGKKPDFSFNRLNWRIESTVQWCVKSGVVVAGLVFTEQVTDGGMREINSVVASWTAAGLPSRTGYADWDFQFGFCPWCAEIDVDLKVTVDNRGHYWGYYTWNGDGF